MFKEGTQTRGIEMTIAASQPNSNSSQGQEPPTPLSPKEKEVMVLYSNPYLEKGEIAIRLFISIGTLNNHILKAFEKLGESDRFAAAVRFWRAYPECWKQVEKEIEKAFQEAA